MITNVSVFDTLADNAADIYVDANNFLRIGNTRLYTGGINSQGIRRTPAVSGTAGVRTVTFTSQNSYYYLLKVTGYTASGQRITLPFTYTTGTSGNSATTIANAFAAAIEASPIGGQLAAVGGTTLGLTGTTVFPDINTENPNSDSNIDITTGTQTNGVSRVGYGADLLVEYAAYVTSAQITATASYTQWEIDYNPSNQKNGVAQTEEGLSTHVILINEAATSSGSNTPAMNLAFVQGDDYTYVGSIAGATITNGTLCLGTLPGLKKGYRIIITSPATTTAAITVTTGAIALALGSATFTTLDADLGDTLYISVSGTTAFTTYTETTLKSITSATAGTGTNITAITAAVFKILQKRPLPR